MLDRLEKDLRQRIAQLEEQVAWYKSTLGLSMESSKRWHLCHELQLTMLEARVLLFLHDSTRPQSAGYVHAAMYDNAEPSTDIKIVDVYIWKLRKKLGKDIIATVYAEGYKLTDKGRKLVGDKLAALPAKAVRDAA